MLNRSEAPDGRRPKRNEYRGDTEIKNRFKKLFKPKNRACITVEEHPVDPIECIRWAVEEEKFKKIVKGVWYCCMKKDGDDQTRTFCVMYRLPYGNCKVLSHLFDIVYDFFPESKYKKEAQTLCEPKDMPAILNVLHANTRRVFRQQSKNTRYIPYVNMYTITARFQCEESKDGDDASSEKIGPCLG